jgi:hypothetical protein
MRRRYVMGATAAGAAAAYLLARPWHLSWGATDQEFGDPLPGDELIANPDITATRAITIRASADQVWPWIAQLGQGRGGFYDFLENLVGADIHSADRIVPELQDIEVGDEVLLGPKFGYDIALLERGRSLVLRGGFPMENVAPHTTPPGRSCSEPNRRERRACSCASGMRTSDRGHGSSSSPRRRSAS